MVEVLGKHRAVVTFARNGFFMMLHFIHLPSRCFPGQLRLGREGELCLSQKGTAAGVDDAAAHGAITASSSADAVAHGANMAVDGSSRTFWARREGYPAF